MFTISRVCLIVSVLILALLPICAHGDKGEETCTRNSGTLETEEECFSTENVRTIPHNEHQPEQEDFMEKKEGNILSEENTGETPAIKAAQQKGGVDKIIEKEDRKEDAQSLRKEGQHIHTDRAKLIELKRKEMEARQQGQKQYEATNKAEQMESGVADKTDEKKINEEIKSMNQKEADGGKTMNQEEHKRQEERAKLIKVKRKEMEARELEQEQRQASKVAEERLKEKVAKKTEQNKSEASTNATIKQKPKGNTPVIPSQDPKRIASAVNKDIKEDDERRADHNEKVHLDIEEFTEKQAFGSSEGASADVHLAVQVCGDRMPETVVLLKSARMLSRVHLHFHVFAEEELKSELKQQWESWSLEARKKTTLDIRSLSFPQENAEKWKALERGKICASQRLFLPDLLWELDAVLYVDTDIVFMRPPEDFWRLFHYFNNSHIAALTREQEEGSKSWYNRYARCPYVHPIGVNSGVILMNLTRMRTENWVPAITSYFTQYKIKLTWGDQDLINIFFHFNPEMLYLFQCHWNYRADHCMITPLCPPAHEYGANLVHGSRRVFINNKKPTFKAIYNAFKEHNFEEDLGVLLERLKTGLAAANIQHRPCGRVSGSIIKQLQRQVSLSVVTKAHAANKDRNSGT